MRKILVDTDIVMDFITKREPFDKDASLLFNMGDKNEIELFISSLCLNNLYYLLRKVIGHKKTIAILMQLVAITEILSVDKQVVLRALHSKFSDFEDALQHFSAVENGSVDVIVTRNLKDYKHSKIPVMNAGSFIQMNSSMG